MNDGDEAKAVKRVYDLVVGEGLNLRKATIRLVSEVTTARSGKTWEVGSMPGRTRTAIPSGETQSGSTCLGS